MLESVCVRLDSALQKQVERSMVDFNYSTKTDFIREAIRDKLKANEKERAMKVLVAMRGIFKGQAKEISEEEMGKKIMKHYEKKFGFKLE